MILLFFVISIEYTQTIDSLKTLLDMNHQLNTALELNLCYLKYGDFNNSYQLLKNYEKKSPIKEKPIIIFHIGENLLFSGKILSARDEYLRLVGLYPHSNIANDALERIYFIESVRKDTVSLKRIVHFLYLHKIEQYTSAEDSIKKLLKTKIGDYAYYYLAIFYSSQEKLLLALSALNELNSSYPDHKIHNTFLLLAEIQLKLDQKKDARKTLEDLIVKRPTSIYALRARQMLKEHFTENEID